MTTYLDDLQFLQLSKTVFILAKFCSNKLFLSADKGCLILVPRSDLSRPRDFYGFDRFEILHFLPFLSYAKSCEDGAYFLEFALFWPIEIHILAHEDMVNV